MVGSPRTLGSSRLHPDPDLGISVVAIFYSVLGLHQLLGFLNHLPPESSDTLLGAEPVRVKTQLGPDTPLPLLSLTDHVSKSRLFLQSMCILRGQGAIPTAGLGMEQVSCRVSRGSGPCPAPHWSILGRDSPTKFKPTAPYPDLCLFHKRG